MTFFFLFPVEPTSMASLRVLFGAAKLLPLRSATVFTATKSATFTRSLHISFIQSSPRPSHIVLDATEASSSTPRAKKSSTATKAKTTKKPAKKSTTKASSKKEKPKKKPVKKKVVKKKPVKKAGTYACNVLYFYLIMQILKK